MSVRILYKDTEVKKIYFTLRNQEGTFIESDEGNIPEFRIRYRNGTGWITLKSWTEFEDVENGFTYSYNWTIPQIAPLYTEIQIEKKGWIDGVRVDDIELVEILEAEAKPTQIIEKLNSLVVELDGETIQRLLELLSRLNAILLKPDTKWWAKR